MNRRHVLQTLAVFSTGSTTIAAFGELSSPRLAVAAPRSLCVTLRESRKLCIDILGRLDRADYRGGLTAGANSTLHQSATHGLQELLVLLEQNESCACNSERRAVALSQACVDSLLRIEVLLNSLYEQGTLPRSIVDSSIAVFAEARQLLSSPSVA